MLNLTNFESYKRPQVVLNHENLKRYAFCTTTGVSAAIIPNKLMNVNGIVALLAENTGKRLLILDNNPFNSPADKKAMKEFLGSPETCDRLRVVDHHGPYNDGLEKSTFPRLLEAIPNLIRDGFLCADTVALTNMQNLDPDGILSMFAAAHPEVAKKFEALLSDTANYTDFAIFGGEKFDQSFSLQNLPDYKILGLALLQLITNLKEDFVERITGTSTDLLGRDAVRAVFIPKNKGEIPDFDEGAVKEIYFEIINDKLFALLRSYEAEGGPSVEMLALAIEADIRLRHNYRNAVSVTQTYGKDQIHPAGKIAMMTEETGFAFRLDSNYVIYDWLLESAAQYCSDAPIHLRVYRGLLVVSVRHRRSDEVRPLDYDLTPLIDSLNHKLIACRSDATLYGRKEVVLGTIDTQKLSPLEIKNLILEGWNDIARVRV